MADLQQGLQEFAEITKFREPLAPYTLLKLGGAAAALVQPRAVAELAGVVQRSSSNRWTLRLLGNGCNVLVPDEGVAGVVVRLSKPDFSRVSVQGERVRAGGGTALSVLISQAASHGLAGLETLVGTLGTVGGAVRLNAGDRAGEIGQFVRKVEVLDNAGQVQVREGEDLRFGYGSSSLDDPVILAAEFELERDGAAAIVKRMRKAWIQRKAGQPYSFQAAARIFKNPRGLNAAALIEQAGLAGTRVGAAEVNDRHTNYIVAHPGCTARDVLRLIDLLRVRVRERFHVELELEISVW